MSLNNSFLTKFNEICRTCLKEGQLLTYLYDEDNNINIVKKLKSCTALQFDKNDQMPNKICPTCIEELLQAYNFINKCQISDATLKKYFLNQSVVMKIEDVPDESVKIEEPENDDTIIDEFFNIDSDITIKDELICLAESPTFTETGRKRLREEVSFDCSVDLSAKKKRSDCDNVLINAPVMNNTFSGVESAITDDVDDVQPVRRTRSETGKENLAKLKGKKSVYQRRRKMKYICPVCDKRWGTDLKLLAHLQSHTETNDNDQEKTPRLSINSTKQNHTNQCQLCKETSNGPEDLLNHYKKHITTNKCEYCCKLFKPATLRKHILNEHTGSHPYKCDLCKERMPDADALLSHKIQLHSVEKFYRCAVCSCTFNSVKELKSHVIEHVRDAPPHFCQTCQRTFEDAHCLIVHKVGDKCGRFYTCCDCPEIFQQLKYRNLHKTKH